jgi:monoamine oxidase
MGFVVSDVGERWRQKSREERQQAIAEQYARLFGCEKALIPLAYVEHDWNAETFSNGCPTAVPMLGRFVQTCENLRKPFHRVHFAGTGTL